MARLTLSFKGTTLKLIPLGKGPATIGSAPQCTVHIDSLALQPQHAVIEKMAGGWRIRDLDTAEGTFVNDKRIDEHSLEEGDVIRVGKHSLTFNHGPDELELSQGGEKGAFGLGIEGGHKAWLQILNGQNLGKTISLHRKLTNLGRSGVQTALIARRNDGFFLSHLEGDQPPLVDGRSIGEHAHELKDGEIIQIGNVRMQFYLE